MWLGVRGSGWESVDMITSDTGEHSVVSRLATVTNISLRQKY